MADGGFEVDLGELRAASNGVNGILEQVTLAPVDGLAQDVGTFGSQDAAAAMAGFAAAWQRGMNDLVAAAGGFAAGLAANVSLYQDAEDNLRAHIRYVDGELSGSGLDPQVWAQ